MAAHTDISGQTQHEEQGVSGRQIEVLYMRDGGLAECSVPIELIDNEEVPVKDEWAQSLAQNMRETAASSGSTHGNGQLTPLVLGRIQGEEKLKIIDGFHRSAALAINGEDVLFATIVDVTWDELYDLRIFTAKDHPHIRFSRVVQWIREVWQHSGLADKLTVQQAVLMYRFGTDGSKLGLDPVVVAEAKAWVQRKESQWQLKAMTMHSYLVVAESVAPELVHATREKTSGKVLEAPTQSILKVFADLIPGRHELQHLVMETAKQRNLKTPDVKALCVRAGSFATIEEAREFIDRIDWGTWTPEYARTKKRALRRAHDVRHSGARVLRGAEDVLDNVMARVLQSLEGDEPVDDAMRTNIREAEERVKALVAKSGDLLMKLAKLAGDEPPKPAPASIPTQPSRVHRIDHGIQHRPVVRAPRPPQRPPAPPPADSKPLAEREAETDELPEVHESHRGEFQDDLRAYLNNETDTMPAIYLGKHAAIAERVLRESFSGDVRRQDEVRDELAELRAELDAKVRPR